MFITALIYDIGRFSGRIGQPADICPVRSRNGTYRLENVLELSSSVQAFVWWARHHHILHIE